MNIGSADFWYLQIKSFVKVCDHDSNQQLINQILTSLCFHAFATIGVRMTSE